MAKLKILIRSLPYFLFCAVLQTLGIAAQPDIRGIWAFHLPDNYPVWLKVVSEQDSELLWSIGKARPIEVIELSRDRAVFHRDIYWKPFGRKSDQNKLSGPLVATLQPNDNLQLVVPYQLNGREYQLTLFGKRMPPLPERPDLKEVRFGDPIDLLAEGLAGWQLSDPEKRSGWSILGDTLLNESPKKDHGAYGRFGNLMTVKTFYDFELEIEYMLPEGGNSGIYLRGAYEVQVVDDPGSDPTDGGPGSVYGRITPTKNASKPGGQWNHYRILLVDRHITVEYNGQRVIDNQPLPGCTGGGINADDTVAGPLLLQGDHTTVRYRNILLRPRLP